MRVNAVNGIFLNRIINQKPFSDQRGVVTFKIVGVYAMQDFQCSNNCKCYSNYKLQTVANLKTKVNSCGFIKKDKLVLTI